MIKSKAGFFQKFRKHIRYNRAKANYLDAFEDLTPMRKEIEAKRFIKDAMPKMHLHTNPKQKWQREHHPSGETI